MGSFSDAFKTLGEIAQRSLEAFDRLIETLVELRLGAYPHKRSLYLTTHGSPRVRKKNQKRYQRWLKKINRIR